MADDARQQNASGDGGGCGVQQDQGPPAAMDPFVMASAPVDSTAAPTAVASAVVGAPAGTAPPAAPSQPAEADGGTTDPPLSKNQQKKLAKKERYLATKADRRAGEKAKKKAARAEKKHERDEEFQGMTPEQRKRAIDEAHDKRRARKNETKTKQERLAASLAEGNQRLAIDLDYESCMVESDQRHLCQQLSYSYSANSKVARPCHFHLLGLHGGLKALADKALPGMAQWHMTRSDKPWNEFLADKLDQVVYLTADSPNELDDLDSTKIYIIGGLVDHNKHKGICYSRAVAAGVATARLPISKHVKLGASAVLTVNHVVQLIAEYVNNRDWATVIDQVLPKRKRADWQQAKRAGGGSGAGGASEGTSTGAGDDDGATEQDNAIEEVEEHEAESDREGAQEAGGEGQGQGEGGAREGPGKGEADDGPRAAKIPRLHDRGLQEAAAAVPAANDAH